jgi:hypothetical protein
MTVDVKMDVFLEGIVEGTTCGKRKRSKRDPVHDPQMMMEGATRARD